MKSIYTSGAYLEATATWHTEDSPWKAAQITKIIIDNGLRPIKIAEIGCGAGAILDELAKKDYLRGAHFKGFDIAPQAIDLAKQRESPSVQFSCEDFFSRADTDSFDILLAIDVFEHIPDFMGFLEKCQRAAQLKIYHIPLDIHVSSVLRNAFIRTRYTIGHIHYFTADSAIAALRDTGHEIVDYFYTNAAFGLFREHPSLKKAVANGPRWLLSKVNLPFAARLLGGYSLMVLAK